jgi:hypothetical protein
VDRLREQLQEMSVREIVRWLATPAASGFYLSADDLARIGRGSGIAVAPFSRTGAIEQLLRGSALDGRLDDMLAALRQEMQAQLEGYRAQQIPELDGWIERGEATLEAWSAIEQAFVGD